MQIRQVSKFKKHLSSKFENIEFFRLKRFFGPLCGPQQLLSTCGDEKRVNVRQKETRLNVERETEGGRKKERLCECVCCEERDKRRKER
jgi:hypothetical protein